MLSVRKEKDHYKPQIEAEYYFKQAYDSKERFISYWHQIHEIINLGPKSLLEVGIGNGFVASYLRARGFKMSTLDIDGALKPDKIGSVLAIPFADRSFELVTCCEVLEHLPYEDFPKALSEINRVTAMYAVLSLPDSTRTYRVNIQLPKMGELRFLLPFPRMKARAHVFDGQHYWEIGKAGWPLGRIIAEMRKAGFQVKSTSRVFEVPSHRFFLLAKQET